MFSSNSSVIDGIVGHPQVSSSSSLEPHDFLACQNICALNVCSSLQLTLECVQAFIFPTGLEWVFIGLHLLLFSVGVLGNLLVCLVVLRSAHMQTITNLFIVNLAVADAIVLVLCSPPTVLQSVTETWFLGEVMCKVVIFFQNTVVGVSVLTLSAIAVERYFAICRPLKTRITLRKVTLTVLAIWLLSAAMGSPNITNKVLAHFKHPELNPYLRTCSLGLDEPAAEVYLMFVVVAFYILPMVIIGIFYLIISHHLWHVRVPGATIRESERGPGYESHADVHLESRKKVAKMLIAIVLLFAACYLPINLIFVLRHMGWMASLNDSAVLSIMFMLAHWLCYFNSAINPLIYNFMSVKFKKEFQNVFSCRQRRNTPLHESTYFNNSRMLRNRTISSHSNYSTTRMMRTHPASSRPVSRNPKNMRMMDDENMVSGESV